MSWVRHLTGEEPEVVSASAVEGPARIDASIETELRVPSGATGSVRSAMDRGREVTLLVEGERGRIEVDNPMGPQSGNRVLIETPGGRTAGPIEAGISLRPHAPGLRRSRGPRGTVPHQRRRLGCQHGRHRRRLPGRRPPAPGGT